MKHEFVDLIASELDRLAKEVVAQAQADDETYLAAVKRYYALYFLAGLSLEAQAITYFDMCDLYSCSIRKVEQSLEKGGGKHEGVAPEDVASTAQT